MLGPLKNQCHAFLGLFSCMMCARLLCCWSSNHQVLLELPRMGSGSLQVMQCTAYLAELEPLSQLRLRH